MVVPLVIFFCIALLVHFAHISDSIFVVLDQQRNIDRMFSADMEVLRCVHVLERSVIQQGDMYFKELDTVAGSMYLYSLPNKYRCRLKVGSISGNTYVFKLGLVPLPDMFIVDKEGYAEITKSSDAFEKIYTVHITVSDEDKLFIKDILISN